MPVSDMEFYYLDMGSLVVALEELEPDPRYDHVAYDYHEPGDWESDDSEFDDGDPTYLGPLPPHLDSDTISNPRIPPRRPPNPGPTPGNSRAPERAADRPTTSATVAENANKNGSTRHDRDRSAPEAISPGEKDCTICLETVSSTEGSAKNSCGHIFHLACIGGWLSSDNPSRLRLTCPNCRQELSPEFLSKVVETTLPEGIPEDRPEGIHEHQAELDELAIPEDLAADLIPNQLWRNQFRFHIPNNIVTTEGGDMTIFTFNDALAHDLEVLSTFTNHMYLHERHHAYQGGRLPRWCELVDGILHSYHARSFPQTDYVTQPTLIRLSVVACLIEYVHERGARLPPHQASVTSDSAAFAELLVYGDQLLLDAQREAREQRPGTLAHHEYLRLLDHGDDTLDQIIHRPNAAPRAWRNGRALVLAADQLRVKWILRLRIRARGEGAPPMGPVRLPPTS